MPWRAVHPAMTEERSIPADDADAPTFTLGFWPPLEAEKAKLYVSAVRRRKDDDEEELSPEDAAKRASADLRAFWNMARFGVRGWVGLGEIACETETVQVDGRAHVALTDASCEALYHAGLLLPVALECWKYNNLTDEEKKTSSSPSISPSSTTPTPASAATRPSAPVKNGAASSVSTTRSSTAAPTT